MPFGRQTDGFIRQDGLILNERRGNRALARLMRDLVQQGAVSVYAFVIFAQQAENGEQTVAARLMMERAVTAGDFQ